MSWRREIGRACFSTYESRIEDDRHRRLVLSWGVSATAGVVICMVGLFWRAVVVEINFLETVHGADDWIRIQQAEPEMCKNRATRAWWLCHGNCGRRSGIVWTIPWEFRGGDMMWYNNKSAWTTAFFFFFVFFFCFFEYSVLRLVIVPEYPEMTQGYALTWYGYGYRTILMYLYRGWSPAAI